MQQLKRRSLLQQAFFSVVSIGIAPAFAASQSNTSARTCAPVSGRHQIKLPTGRLSNLGGLRAVDGLGIALPEGFSVRKLAEAGERVPTPAGLKSHSGYKWHTFPDGGAVIARPDGGWVYTSNSEIPLLPLGGCGALAFNADGVVVNAYSILKRTTQNCAGGVTPWRTWISCEECKDGLCWECDPFEPGQGLAKPALGRFAHEAIAVDALRHTVYLTEDIGDGRFYRWTAAAEDLDDNGRLSLEQGLLEVMNIEGFHDDCYPHPDAFVQGQLHVSWIAAEQANEQQDKVRAQLRSQRSIVPGTVFLGGEGLWAYKVPLSTAQTLRPHSSAKPVDTLIFWTTKLDNRVWVLDVANQLVELVFDNSEMAVPFESVDNLTISPWGDILVAEDPPHRDVARLMVVLPNKGAVPLLAIHHAGSEICGPAFSPDGARLYFSSQRYNHGGGTFEVLLPSTVWAATDAQG
ncbi:MAG: hypothetical protein ACI9G5_002545 [Paracoccaceae bacterium]|jgi:hypothetical protein